MTLLLEMGAELVQLERRVGEIVAVVAEAQSTEATDALGALKGELAQLEAAAHRLEEAGVDSIYTGDLQSGKAEAKERKKDMLARLDILFANIDEVFRQTSGR
jgi:sugar/nucleoside kinase (ribokinase family)